MKGYIEMSGDTTMVYDKMLSFEFDWTPFSIQECINVLLQNEELPSFGEFIIYTPNVVCDLFYVEFYKGDEYDTSVECKQFGNGIYVRLSEV